ncbi:hypothetical protein SAMN05216388_10607 [Halorientalis persicus]|uniref:Diguanylate Cyclase and Two-component system sensory domain-containing protein n=1 Tax=Halorientalis persicus TaxID=1367881 RepID=A0A1H8WI73_9EURY|nr:hypothetical protein [Halorientalis persicus]SEP27365.1 hypothetical protein SAMN05216388_10607 [Halorientalis persicus]
MMAGQPASLADFLPRGNDEYEVFVARRSEVVDFDTAIDAIFEATPIDVSEEIVEEVEEDTLVLFQNGRVVSVTPVREFTYLVDQITAEIGQTATVSLANLRFPSILVELAGGSFEVISASSNHPVLLFTTISRCIEAQSWEQRRGQLRVGVQYLSRLTDTGDPQTRAVYEQLAETDVEVHVYGMPDKIPPSALDLTVHGGRSADFTQNWFVSYQSPPATTIAFIAHEFEGGRWRGHWTFDTDRVEQLTSYLKTLCR